MEPWTEAYLYAAARADHARREILPRLVRGQSVLCERYLDSSLAYQGFGRRLGLDAVQELNAHAIAGVLPDRTFYLKLPAEERERRARKSNALLDRIEQGGDGFMRRVEAGFEELARREPERIVVVDAGLPPEEVAETVMREVLTLHYTRRQD